jgi:hypothetical protein
MTNDAVTILKSTHGCPVNKSIRRLGDTIIKAMAKNGGCYVAQTVPAPDLVVMGDILRELGDNADATMSLGLFRGAPDEPFLVLPRKVLAQLTSVDPNDKDSLTGFYPIDGWQCAARLKANMVFSSWLLIDRDCVVGMPPDLAALDTRQWLAAMDLLLPGLASAGRILLPSTSCRITVDGKPMESKSHHLFVQVTDPSDIARVWGQILPKAFLTPLNPPWEDTESRSLWVSFDRSSRAPSRRWWWLSSLGAFTTQALARPSAWSSTGNPSSPAPGSKFWNRNSRSTKAGGSISRHSRTSRPRTCRPSTSGQA